MDRREDIAALYELISELEQQSGGRRVLAESTGRQGWPLRGVYFFFEPGENRSGSGVGMRVVRVGTHALHPQSRTSLWDRLRQHRGTLAPPGGNHRGSIFRLLVGDALIGGGYVPAVPSWGVGSIAPADSKDAERSVEQEVSRRLGEMSLIFVAIDDAPGALSLRGYIERNAIALLSGYAGTVDPPSPSWLGLRSSREKVRRSGLWNNNHVDEPYEPEFLKVFRGLMEERSQRVEGYNVVRGVTGYG
jgi:hypothetical protein